MASLGSIFVWWLLALVLSLITLPISARIFKFLPDKGVGLARILGLLLTSYLAWVLGFVHNSVATSIVAWAVVAGVSVWLYLRDPEEVKSLLREKGELLFVYEALFFLMLMLWSLLRMNKPDIVDQEKFMDFAFFNALTRAGHFPPYDPWLAGAKNWLNYYYFGYFSFAQFARMTFLNPAVSYNLVIAFVFALSGQVIVSIGYNLTRAMWPGLVGLGLLQIFGNLHGGLQAIHNGSLNINWWDPTRLIKDVVKGDKYLNHWWWSADPAVLQKNGLGMEAARDGLISEFPNFSFIHGDMHPHFTAIPFTLLALALGLNLVKNEDRDPLNVLDGGASRGSRSLTLGLLALCMSVLFMTNTWDVPAYGVVFSVLLLGHQHGLKRFNKENWLKSWLVPSAAILVGLILFSLLFVLFFSSPAKLIEFKPAFKLGFASSGARTGLHDTLIFWGGFLVILLPFMVLRVLQWATPGSGSNKPAAKKAVVKNAGKCAECGSRLRPGKPFCPQCGHKNAEAEEAVEVESEADSGPLPAAPQLAANFLKLFTKPAEALRDTRVAVTSGVLGVLLLAFLIFAPTSFLFLALALLAALLIAARPEKPEALFALTLLLIGSLLVFAVEWVYLRDVFEGNKSLTRMNTTFKFYFQAWVLFAAAAPFAIHWAYGAITRRLGATGSSVFIAPVSIVLLLAAIYPIGAIKAVTSADDQPATLDGSAWLQRDYPSDHEMILWLRQNIKGKAVIAEAVGGAYTRFARVSSYTGLAAVVGWGNHESQWRREWPTKVEADVNELYSTMDPGLAQILISRYGIQYVFVGSLERSKYSPEQLSKFGLFMDPLHGNPAGTIVYKTR